MTTMLRLASKKLAGQNLSLAAKTTAARSFSTVPEWASCNPWELGDNYVHDVLNCVDGKWTGETKSKLIIPDPMDRSKNIFTIPDTQENELEPFFESLRRVPKTGLHNPLKNPERYVQYGEISRLVRPKHFSNIFNYFSKYCS